MALPVSVQLYSVREYAKKDFAATLKRIADIGYVGVQPAGFFNLRPSEFKKICDDLGLKIFGTHSPWGGRYGFTEQLDILGILGLDSLACGYGPDDYKDLDAIRRTADKINELQDVCDRNGITLFQHNHYWEFGRIDGKLKYDILRELCPNLKYEIDCFWSTNRGLEDPVEMLSKFLDKTVIIHMKDGVCTRDKDEVKVDLLPLGQGEMPIKKLVEMSESTGHVSSVVVELDYCNIEMFQALEQSYRFVVGNGICAGNK